MMVLEGKSNVIGKGGEEYCVETGLRERFLRVCVVGSRDRLKMSIRSSSKVGSFFVSPESGVGEKHKDMPRE